MFVRELTELVFTVLSGLGLLYLLTRYQAWRMEHSPSRTVPQAVRAGINQAVREREQDRDERP